MSFLISPPVLQSHYYVPFASRLCTWKFNHGEALDYAFYPVLFFCSVVFLFTTIWTDFYLNVLCSAFLFSFLFQYVSVLYSTTQFWCLLALHVLFLPRSSAGLLLVTHSIVLFGSIYLLIIHCTLFPFSFSHFAQADVFPCLATTPVRISFLTECLSSKLHFYHTSLPPKYVHQPYWLAPLYWERITAHTLPCIKSVLGQPALFLDSWPRKLRPIGCPETSVSYYFSLLNNPEQRSSKKGLVWNNDTCYMLAL
jgi:hypothetical protein